MHHLYALRQHALDAVLKDRMGVPVEQPRPPPGRSRRVEAGGIVADVDGGDRFLNTGEILAGSPKVFEALRRALPKVSVG